MRRYKQFRKHFSASHSNEERKYQGYGINLYRNTENGMISGVCAGLADQFDISANVVRWIFFGSFFFLGMVPVLLYIIAWVLLAPRPETVRDEYRYDEQQHRMRRKNMFNYSPDSSNRLKEAERRMSAAMERVENMERYVTSRAYRINRELGEI